MRAKSYKGMFEIVQNVSESVRVHVHHIEYLEVNVDYSFLSIF